MEKRYVAFLNGSGCSGLQTREIAIKWASDQMGNKSVSAYLCEVTDVIERKFPPIEVRPISTITVGDQFGGFKAA